MKEGVLNVSGALLFAKNPSFRLPIFIVKAITFPGIEIHEEKYIDSQDITGKLADIFHKSMSFVLGNIKHVQKDQGINAPGEPEIPRIVLEELIANALIHRDYFISAPVRIFVFQNRVEIVSPGHLPNNLTIENIKRGNSNIRNPILASYATKILPYRGLGSGIIRALRAYPNIDFVDDHDGNLFKAIIKRS
jgi:ATP-dependent DNA helicase RecG